MGFLSDDPHQIPFLKYGIGRRTAQRQFSPLQSDNEAFIRFPDARFPDCFPFKRRIFINQELPQTDFTLAEIGILHGGDLLFQVVCKSQQLFVTANYLYPVIRI